MTKAAELAKMGEVLTNSQIGGRRNIAINGAMKISQRATSSTGLGASAGYFTLDRFRISPTSTAGRLTMEQVAITDLSGFANCLKFTTTTADTSIASGEKLILQTKFEGQDLQQLQKGTSTANKFTLSFYVKGNAAAIYSVEIKDTDNNRSNTQSFAVTTSWNRIELTFAGDTTGVLDDDNAESISVNIWLHGGSDFTSGTYASNTWATTTNANRYAVANRTSIFDSTDRTFFLTGLQLEVGEQATPFEHRSFGEELALCQRYYEKLSTTVNYHLLTTALAYSSTNIQYHYSFKVVKRASPTFTFSAAATFSTYTAAGSNTGTASAIDVTSTTNKEMRGTVTGGSGLSAGNASFLIHNGTQSDEAIINIDAEL